MKSPGGRRCLLTPGVVLRIVLADGLMRAGSSHDNWESNIMAHTGLGDSELEILPISIHLYNLCAKAKIVMGELFVA